MAEAVIELGRQAGWAAVDLDGLHVVHANVVDAHALRANAVDPYVRRTFERTLERTLADKTARRQT